MFRLRFLILLGKTLKKYFVLHVIATGHLKFIGCLRKPQKSLTKAVTIDTEAFKSLLGPKVVGM